MSDELEQPGTPQDSAQADNAGGENQHDTGSEDQNGLDQSNEDSQEHADEEEEEIEVGERRLSLPKSVAEKLKAERLMHADYTRKTQELAEQRRQFETSSAEQQKSQKEFLQDHAKVIAIGDQLAELNKINLADFVDSDPVWVQRVMLQKQELQAQYTAANAAVTQKQQQFALNEQQSIAKQVQEASAYVSREIPGWSNGRDNELGAYVEKNGLQRSELGHIVLKHPALMKMIHKAEMYDRQERKATAKPAAPAQEKPVTRVTAARTVATRDPSKMSTDEWMAHRNAQLRKK